MATGGSLYLADDSDEDLYGGGYYDDGDGTLYDYDSDNELLMGLSPAHFFSSLGLGVFPEDSGGEEENLDRNPPGETGGYDCQFVTEVPSTLQCLICTYASRDAHQIECCGKVFCRSCLSKLKRTEHRACPNCRKDKWKSFPDKKSERDIQSLRVKCSNLVHGCVWQGDLRELEKHVMQCNVELVSCKYTSVGCNAKVLKVNLQSHEDSCTTQHLKMAVEKVKMLTKRLEAMEKRVCAANPSVPPVVMKMSDFIHHKTSKILWNSPSFYTHPRGYKLCLQVKSFGTDRFGDISVSVKVCLVHGEHDEDLVWPFRGVVNFEILNQVSDTDHVVGIAKFLEKKKSARNTKVSASQGISLDGWSESHLLLFSDSDFTNFMQKDCMFFRVSVIDVLPSNKPWLI